MKTTTIEPKYKKSSLSNHDKRCVEVAITDQGVLVRNSRSRDLAIEFTHGEWSAFIAGVKGSEFELPTN